MCVCSLSYPACDAHALCYIRIYNLSGFAKFFHIVSQTEGFKKKKLFLTQIVVILSTNFVSNISHSKRN